MTLPSHNHQSSCSVFGQTPWNDCPQQAASHKSCSFRLLFGARPSSLPQALGAQRSTQLAKDPYLSRYGWDLQMWLIQSQCQQKLAQGLTHFTQSLLSEGESPWLPPLGSVFQSRKEPEACWAVWLIAKASLRHLNVLLVQSHSRSESPLAGSGCLRWVRTCFYCGSSHLGHL